jgi:transcriptional regulator with XRE-family HTH domain
MPKIKPLMPRKTKDPIRQNLRRLLDDAGLSQAEFCRQTGLMCPLAFSYKLKDPNKFTVGELRIIAKHLNVDLSEVI